MASKPIFVDTHGFYVWADAADPTHGHAESLLHTSGRRFVTTEWIVVETVNLFVARRKPHWAEGLLDFLRETTAVRILGASSEQFHGARTLWRKYREHAFPMTDCTSFVVMRELGLKDVLTADRHFQVMGFNPLLAD